jgi:alpha-glucoside transport system substrate-binding protein
MNISKRAMGLACAAALVLGACGSDTDTGTSGDTTAEGSSDATTGGGTDTGDGLLGGAIPCDNQFEGKTVTVFSPVRDSDTDTPVADYVAGYEPLMECTGLEIEWQGTDQFETEINVRLEGGDAPDVIDYPQPGLMAGHARRGYLVEFPEELAEVTNSDFIEGWAGYATIDDKVYGIPGRSNIKSLVWYSPSAFADAGYEIPESIEDLAALSDQIVTDGGTPWCVGAESGVATGWVLTDWMEDFMLRTNGEEVYDQWVNHEIPFNDPKVVDVVEAVGAFVKNPDYLGGDTAVKSIATTKFQDGGLPILSGDCFMHRQASFYSSLWPEGTEIGPEADINFFYLPSPADGPKYMLGAGDIYAAGTDKPETFAVLRYTGSPDYQLHIVNTRSELSPNINVDLASIEDPLVKQLSELQSSADVFRFDGSDLMPGAVGSGTFWTEVTAWIIGGSTEDFVDNVEASWPS